MPIYEAWIPAYCTRKVTLQTDDVYDISDETQLKELKLRIVEEGEDQSILCHRCSDNLENDGGLITDDLDFSVRLSE